MIGYGSGQTLAHLFSYGAMQVDRTMLGRFGSVDGVGLYERAAYLMNLPVTILGRIMDTVGFSGLARIQDQLDKLRLAFRTGVSFAGVLSMALFVFLEFQADEVILIVLGADWTEAIPIYRILLLAMLLRSLTKMKEPLLRATGHVYSLSGINFAFLAVVIVATYIGVWNGLAGVAWGYVQALFVQYALMTIVVLRVLDLKFSTYLSFFGGPLMMALLTVLFAGGTNELVHLAELPAALRFAATALITGVGLLGMCWWRPAVLGRSNAALLLRLGGKLPIPASLLARIEAAANNG